MWKKPAAFGSATSEGRGSADRWNICGILAEIESQVSGGLTELEIRRMITCEMRAKNPAGARNCTTFPGKGPAVGNTNWNKGTFYPASNKN